MTYVAKLFRHVFEVAPLLAFAENTLNQPPAFPLRGVLVEEKVVAVVHVDDWVTLVTSAIIVGQIKMDGPP